MVINTMFMFTSIFVYLALCTVYKSVLIKVTLCLIYFNLSLVDSVFGKML